MNFTNQPPAPAAAPLGLLASISASLEALRPKQWIKNTFVLVPLVFSQALTDLARLQMAVMAFTSFCLAASSLYLLNDLIDRQEDRLHPSKRHRPIASGRVSAHAAVLYAVLALAGGLAYAFTFNPRFALLLCLYWTINLVYSLTLKHMVVLDVMIIAFGFVLRVVAGAVAVGVAASHWLLLCAFLLALFLGFNKRRHELSTLLENSGHHRRVLVHYTPELLDQMNTVVLGATVVSYALYTVSAETIARFHTDRLIYTFPFVIYGLFRYLYLTHRCNEGGSPADLLFKDGPLILCVWLWACACTAIIYFDFLH